MVQGNISQDAIRKVWLVTAFEMSRSGKETERFIWRAEYKSEAMARTALDAFLDGYKAGKGGSVLR